MNDNFQGVWLGMIKIKIRYFVVAKCFENEPGWYRLQMTNRGEKKQKKSAEDTILEILPPFYRDN